MKQFLYIHERVKLLEFVLAEFPYGIFFTPFSFLSNKGRDALSAEHLYKIFKKSVRILGQTQLKSKKQNLYIYEEVFMMNKKYCVYIHTNKTNQKRYIGMTGLNPKERWGKNGFGYHTQLEFFDDILKYGWDGFKHEIVYDNLTKPDAQEKEIELIKKYKTYDSNYGYNKYCKTLREYNYYIPKEKEKLIHCVELNLTFKTSLAAMEATGVDHSSILKACKGVRQSAGKHPETNERLHWKYIYIQKEEEN